MEGNLRFKIDWASLIVWKGIYHFCFVLLCFPSTSPWGLIFGGAI